MRPTATKYRLLGGAALLIALSAIGLGFVVKPTLAKQDMPPAPAAPAPLKQDHDVSVEPVWFADSPRSRLALPSNFMTAFTLDAAAMHQLAYRELKAASKH